MEQFFQNFGLSGYAENEIYAIWLQKWPKDGPSYDNVTKMFHIKSLSMCQESHQLTKYKIDWDC